MKINNKTMVIAGVIALVLLANGCQMTPAIADDITTYYKEAEKAVIGKSYEEALNSYSAALQALDGSASQSDLTITKGIIYFNMGFCHEQLGELDQAIEWYLKSREEPDTVMLADTALGGVYFQMKAYDISINYYEAAIKEDATAYEAYVNLSAIYAIRDNYDEAVSLLTKAIEVDSTKADAYINRAYLFASLSDEARMNEDIQALKKMKFKSLDVYIKIFNDTLQEGRN